MVCCILLAKSVCQEICQELVWLATVHLMGLYLEIWLQPLWLTSSYFCCCFLHHKPRKLQVFFLPNSIRELTVLSSKKVIGLVSWALHLDRDESHKDHLKPHEPYSATQLFKKILPSTMNQYHNKKLKPQCYPFVCCVISVLFPVSGRNLSFPLCKRSHLRLWDCWVLAMKT